MSWYPWSIPDEALAFVLDCYKKHRTDPPADKALDHGIAFVIEYVGKNYYYPRNAEEALYRWQNPQLTEPEKFSILGPLEILVKVYCREKITFDQLWLMTWATLLFCWSEGGEAHVQWFRKNGVAEANRASLGVSGGWR